MSADTAPPERAVMLANLRLALIALLLAVVTWFAINGAISNETQIEGLPIRILPQEGWAVLDQSSETIDIRFRGSEQDLGALNRDNVQVVVDIRGEELVGRRTMTIRPEVIKVPGGARPVSIRPSTVTVELDRESERVVPVKVDRVGESAPGFSVEEIVCKPAAVQLRGPQQQIEAIQEVRTVPVDLEGKIRSFSVRSGLVPPSKTWSSRMDPEKVLVEITMVERSETRTLPDVPVAVLVRPGFNPQVRLEPDRVRVTLKGQLGVIQDLPLDAVQAYVDAYTLEPDAEYDIPVRVALPARALLESVEPKTVHVQIQALSPGGL